MTEYQNNQGLLIWITGLPGSGKTTLARETYRLLRTKLPIVQMDGDIFREIMGSDLRYTIEDRKKNAYRLVKMNKHIVDNGVNIICSTVSLYQEIHDWNNQNIANLVTVYIDVPIEILKQRNKSDLYSQISVEGIDNLGGINQAYQKLQNPQFTILNDSSIDIFLSNAQKIADLALQKIKSKNE